MPLKLAIKTLALATFALNIGHSTAFAEEKAAYFAGGCFWCIEKDFESVPGVAQAVSGYQGGTLENPTYRNHEGHREVVKIDYDSTKVSYDELLKIFLQSVDPTDGGGQFCDRGYAYTTAVYTQNDDEKKSAELAIANAQDKLGKTIATQIEDFSPFTKAEEYHQDYYKKNPLRYKFYRSRCGRDQRVEALWGGDAHYGIIKQK